MKNSKDIILTNINISVPTKSLIVDSELKIIYGQRYALISPNGKGKTTLLNYINDRTLLIPKYIDIFMVCQELDFDHNKTIYEIVSDANFKKNKILEKLNEIESDPDQFEKYEKLQQKLKDLDHLKDESKIRKILYGLGFSHLEQDKTFSSFSGGWKMRCAIARGLFMQPHLLLLDEPTNHLDINSVIWLTEYLKKWNKSLIIVSHDTYFINQICNKVIHIDNNKLNYYNGNYDTFTKLYDMHILELGKAWAKIQKRKKEMQNKSTKKEIVNKFLKDNAHLEPPKPYKVKIFFSDPPSLDCDYINLSDVTFGYNKTLFQNINLCVGSKDKYVIVGANGVGKTTLIQLIAGDIEGYSGEIIKKSNIKMGYYNQHLTDILPLDNSPIQFLQSVTKSLNVMDAQKYLGSIGLEGNLHNKPINNLSGGQKSRVLLASLRSLSPHILLLDEPTNHLDIESIEALIFAINNFNGAVIMITHNIDVIEKTNSRLLHMKDATLTEITYDDYCYEVLDEIEQF